MRGCVPYLAVIASMLCFAQATSASEATPVILVAVAPLTPYVNAITGNTAHAESLLRPGQDPHHFSLAPSQQQLLDKADILIVPDLSMSPFIASLAAKQKKLRVIQLSNLPGADPLPYAEENPWVATAKAEAKKAEKTPQPKEGNFKRLPDFNEEEPVGGPETPSVDPHFWLDPERMAALAVPLAGALAESFPGNRAVLQFNAKELATHLRREVMPEMRGLMTPHSQRNQVATKPIIPFITYHAAYQYFLARFRVKYEGELTARPEDYLGAKSLDTLYSAAKQVKIRCVIGEAPSSLMTRVAELSDAKIVILSPEQNVEQNDVPPLSWMRNDYDRLLYKTAKTFGDCL